MSDIKEIEFKKLTITLLDPNERRAVFERSCELLALNVDKVAQDLNLERNKEGYDVSTLHLINFCAIHSLHGQFDFRTDEKMFEVHVPIVPAVGKVAIESPETIKPTSVDAVLVDEAPAIVLPDASPAPAVGADTSEKNWTSVALHNPVTEEEAGIVEEELILKPPGDAPEEEDEEPDPF